MTAASSNGASGDQHYSTDPKDYITCPRVTLTIEYDPESSSITKKPPTSPEDLYKAIQILGRQDGVIIHSKGAGTEWKDVAFDITYRKSKTNMLHLAMTMGWPSCEVEKGNAGKVEYCVKTCVGKAFGIAVDNGVGSMLYECKDS